MIYYVEDDDSIRELVVYTLNQMGMETRGFTCGDEFWPAMEKKLPELILLDVMLPEEDGLSVLRRLRANAATVSIPVIMLTAKDSEYDRVVALDLGAEEPVYRSVAEVAAAEDLMRLRSALQKRLDESLPMQTQLGASFENKEALESEFMI